jgi:hypothetical protein
MNQLEHTVMSYGAAKDTKIAAQLSFLVVSRREHTGVGCYTHFTSVALPPESRINHPGPYLQLRLRDSRLPLGGGVIFWVGGDGAIDQLEFYCHAGDFPNEDFKPDINENGA